MLTELDASALRRWCVALADGLAAHQPEIDQLNVYPVPDGDTGTNMSLTARAAADALGGADAIGAGQVLQAISRGAVLGARGNSGVILSQLLRGLAESAGDTPALSADALCQALQAAAAKAYASVGEPVEGTILSVANAVAEAVKPLAGSELTELPTVAREALRAAQDALARTPEQLDVLARAGVVDAGGRGLVVVLEALCEVVTGDAASTAAPPAAGSATPLAVREGGSAEYDYEVQYLLDAAEPSIAALREALSALGDSLAVVGTGDGVWNVHIHVNDIGAALEAGIQAGRPHRITVQRFAEQAVPGSVGRDGVAVVAVAPGAGLAHLFGGAGVHVVGGGPGNNPSTAEVLAAVRASGAASVVLLPNAAQVYGVADMVAEEARAEGIEVAVVRTRSPVQGLAAVAVYDPQRRFGDLVVAMAETAAATQWAEITVAVRAALTMAGPCAAGDVLGLIGGEVVEIGSQIERVAERLLDRLLGVGGELVTLVLGADAEQSLAARLTARIGASAPLVEVCTFTGGQPDYPLIIGVE